MIKKPLFVLVTIVAICMACQPVETTDPAMPSPQAPAPTETALPPDLIVLEKGEPALDGLIVFYSDRDGNPEIYTMNADGSNVTRLTDDPAFDDSPALSPDGARIAFLTARHDPNPQFPHLEYEIYVMDADGSNPRRLTETETAEDHPAWSPDGTQILFDADYDGDGFYEIYTMNADGSDVTRLTSNQANDQFADWSSDGSQIAFSSDRNGNWDIFVMEADGSNQRALTDSPDWELFPAWSPDGAQIAYNGLIPRSRNTDVFVMEADGSGVRQLTDSPRFDENPAWSPDGRQILFQTERDGNFELYVMNADGNEQRPLAAHPADELWPSWRPAAAPESGLLRFEKSAQTFPSVPTWKIGLADLDGDGDLDAVFANGQANMVTCRGARRRGALETLGANDETSLFVSDSGPVVGERVCPRRRSTRLAGRIAAGRDCDGVQRHGRDGAAAGNAPRSHCCSHRCSHRCSSPADPRASSAPGPDHHHPV